MVVVIALLTFVAFIVGDLILRFALKRIDAARQRRKRMEALDIGLRLHPSREARSLKRVEIEAPKARILAVDDEPVVLDSFRKILVLAGYSIDTVESGPEALRLIEESDYDFVFTDLKMPEMDGVEVTKAVKHIRPDIDVIMITGYATVQSAVDTMKYGAMDYVEKPFTEDELVAFVDKALIRRQDRIEREQPPRIHLVTATSRESASSHVWNVPAGVFVSPLHVWVRIEMSGEVRVGMDDFARKTIGAIDRVVPPTRGRDITVGRTLFSIHQGTRTMDFPSPVTGRVVRVNEDLSLHPERLSLNPYELGWVCRLEPSSLPRDLESMRIGAEAVEWYQDEAKRLTRMFEELHDAGPAGPTSDAEPLSDDQWKAFSATFLHVSQRDRVA